MENDREPVAPPEAPNPPSRAAWFEALDAAVSDAPSRAAARAVLARALDEVEAREREKALRAERWTHLGQASAGVAHELRNPLTVIETSVFLLKERTQGDPVCERHLRRIADQVTIAGDIVGDLLDTARARPMHSAPVDLPALIHEALASVPREPDVAVAVELAPSLPAVHGDARRLRQVLINLVSNAVHAMASRERPRRLEVSLRAADGAVELAVRDHGPGVAPDDLPRLFEPLFSTRRGGVGLGLSLSRQIVEAHGGALTADNAPGGGARFTLRLPVA